jgi:hypothetical protein
LQGNQWIVFSAIIFCLLIVLGNSIANPVNAGSYDDDIETQRQQAEAEAEEEEEEEEYFILLEDAEDDHNNGIENTDSEHSLEEHNDSNSYNY